MAYMIAIGFVILFMALVGDLYERYLNHIEMVNDERMITMEVEDMEKDYVYLNDGTPVEYNEDDQE